MPPKSKNNKSKESKELKNDTTLEKQTVASIKKQIKKTRGGSKVNIEDSDAIESDSDSEIELDDQFENDEEEDNGEEESENESVESENEEDGDNEDGNGNDCMYKFTNKKSSLEDDDEIEVEDVYFEEDEQVLENIFVPDDKRITRPTLTKYERVRVLGERAKQLSLNAKPMIIGVETLNPKEIAKLELQMGVLPMIIIRPLPTGQKERWKVSELKIVN